MGFHLSHLKLPRIVGSTSGERQECTSPGSARAGRQFRENFQSLHSGDQAFRVTATASSPPMSTTRRARPFSAAGAPPDATRSLASIDGCHAGQAMRVSDRGSLIFDTAQTLNKSANPIAQGLIASLIGAFKP